MFANRTAIALIASITSLAGVSTAKAQFDLSWHSIDGGGATLSTGGVYEVGGAIGQPDAGRMAGGAYAIVGGFWAGVAVDACSLPGNLDGDGDVDLTDLSTLLSNFGTASGATLADGDIDGDGDVDLSDLSVLLANFGLTCP